MIKVLYVEDLLRDRNRFEGWIRNACAILGVEAELDLRSIGDPDEANRILNSEDIDILVTDLLFNEGGEEKPLGISIVATARRKGTKTGILALSIGTPPKYLDAARRAGAHKVSIKQTLIESATPIVDLAALLKTVMEKAGRPLFPSTDATISYDRRDFELVAIAETIGRENLIQIAGQLVGSDLQDVALTKVRAGYSGAIVVRADCRVTKPTGPWTESLLVKLSRDRESLARELKRAFAPEVEDLFVPFKSSLAESGGWSAIASKFVAATRSLGDWLRQSQPEADVIAGTLELLFGAEGLQPLYTSAIRVEETPVTAIGANLTTWRKAAVRQVMQDWADYAADRDKQGAFDAALIEAFLVSQRFGTIDAGAAPDGSLRVWSHGDLHADNILLTQSLRPRLIDPAATAPLHWASDVSRLMVDLILTTSVVWKESVDWLALDVWTQRVATFLDNPSSAVDSSSAWTAVAWLAQRVSTLREEHGLSQTYDWELPLSIAVEFLRATYRVEITPPIRCLALYGACLSIRQAETAYKS